LKPKVNDVCDKCGGQLYQRSDDTAEVLKRRIVVYEQQTQPILEYYNKKRIPSIKFKCDRLDMPPETAVQEILNGLRDLKLIS
jgi:adenylate kinase